MPRIREEIIYNYLEKDFPELKEWLLSKGWFMDKVSSRKVRGADRLMHFYRDINTQEAALKHVERADLMGRKQNSRRKKLAEEVNREGREKALDSASARRRLTQRFTPFRHQ